MTDRLNGKVALITGAAHGIGGACADRFLAEGAQVVLADLEIDAARERAEPWGKQALALQLDVADESSVQSAIAATVEHFGQLDILLNNAGVALPAVRVEDTDNADLERFIGVNLRGPFWGMKHAWPHLKRVQGCVLNLSSMVGVVGQEDHAAYAMTKGGLNALTKSAAVDWGRDRVRVNALCPAGVRTRLLEAWLADHPARDEAEDYLARQHSLGYCAEPEQIASAAAFLCSDDASFVTGALMPVSGGSECGYKV